MKKIILLFVGSFLVTAVFSASLKVFFQSVSWREVLIKGLLIPCFTWTVQLLLSVAFLKTEDRLTYWNRLGWGMFDWLNRVITRSFLQPAFCSTVGVDLYLECARECGVNGGDVALPLTAGWLSLALDSQLGGAHCHQYVALSVFRVVIQRQMTMRHVYSFGRMWFKDPLIIRGGEALRECRFALSSSQS